jgi:hypothetical protein
MPAEIKKTMKYFTVSHKNKFFLNQLQLIRCFGSRINEISHENNTDERY